MKSLKSIVAASAIVLMGAGATVAQADTTSAATTASTVTTTTTAANGSQSTVDAKGQARFVARYEQNLQTEAALLQKAQGMQSQDSAKYAAFVNTVQAQVATLYASETALDQLGFTWGGAITQGADPNLQREEQELKVKIQAQIKAARSHAGKSAKERQAVKKARAQVALLEKEMAHLNVELRTIESMKVKNSDVRYFIQNVESLRASILGLQADAIRVTKAWIASGQETTTTSVYGDTSTTSSVTVTPVPSN